jgi:cell division protein FtsW
VPLHVKSISIYDKWLVLAAAGLVCLGLLMVASSSIVISTQQFSVPFHYLIRQSIFLGLGLICGLVVLRVDTRVWYEASPLLLIAALVLLILVLIPGLGLSVNGARRWLGAGPLRMQVSEVAKLCLIVYLAGYITRHRESLQNNISGFLRPMVVVGVVCLLLLREPDFGAAVVMVATALVMFYLAGVRLWPFLLLFALLVLCFALLAVMSPYRLARLTSFINPWANQYNSGYQLTQSLIAFGRGGWFGVGLGASIQKLFYLPEAHTDFLFAVLAEELGLVGSVTVIALFVLLVGRGLLIGFRACARDRVFQGFVAFGLSLWLGLQAMINIGVNSGLLPTKGLTLPLMSYGGSSMLVMCVVIALLLRIDHETRWQQLGMTHG